MRIQNNIMAKNTHRMYAVNNSAVAESAEKLSSGYRVNRAGDDAAGLAISEKMRAQIRGLTMASKNSQDAVSLVQTAEGALQEIHSMLQRMNELAVQSASDTNDTGVDRKALQQEFENLQEEIDRVAETTTFNDMTIMDGTYGRKGTDGEASPLLPGRNLKVFFLDDIPSNQSTPNPAWAYFQGVTPSGYTDLKNILKDQIVPQAVAALANAFPNTFGDILGSDIGVGLDIVTTGSFNATFAFAHAGDVDNFTSLYRLTVNVSNFDFTDTDTDNPQLTQDGRKDLEATILHEMMHGLMNEALTAGMMGVNADTGEEQPRFPKWFIEGAAQAASGASDWTRSIGIYGNSTEEQIAAALKQPNNLLTSGHNNSQYGSGYLATMYLAHKASGSNTIDAPALAGGLDAFMKTIADGATLDEAIAQYTDYDNAAEFEAGFANDAEAHAFISNLVTAYGAGAGALAAPGGLTQEDGDVLPDTNMTSNGFDLNTTNQWIQNTYDPGYHAVEGGGVTTGVAVNGTDGGGGITGSGKGLVIQTGAEGGQTLAIYIESMTTKGLGVDKDTADITSRQNASDAIGVTRIAINLVSTQRAELGAMQNRLEHKIGNLDNTAENLSAAESRIRDVDMAKEMTNFTKQNILSQAATAMLAQANSAPQGVLSLLQ